MVNNPGRYRAAVFLAALIVSAVVAHDANGADEKDSLAKQVGELYKKQQYFLALTKTNQVLATEPTHIVALISRAQTYLLLGLPKQAIKDCDKFLSLVKTDSDRWNCWLWRGKAALRDDQYEI